MSHKKIVNKAKFIRSVFISIIAIALTVFAIKYISKKQSNKDEENKEIASTNIEEETKTEETSTKTIESTSKLQEKLKTGKYLSSDGLPVLMYHFFYDKSKGETAKDGNWIEISDFEEQVKYLAENDFYFPTWQEVEDYIDEKTELPEKSVVITVDDGDPTFFDLAVPIIQKYNVQATSFVVAYWYGDRAENKEQNISYQSHSYDMHKAGSNGKGAMLSLSDAKIKEDLELSSQSLGGATIFCYPFGHYNENCFKVLKDSGFKLAFTVEGGRVTKKANKYKLPRVRISGNTSMSAFMKKVE